MKFGPRLPSLRRSLSMRFSLRSIIAHRLGGKMPRGLGGLRNPTRAVYNRVYNRTSFSLAELLFGRTPKQKKDDE